MNIDLKQGRLDVETGQVNFKYTFLKSFIFANFVVRPMAWSPDILSISV